MKQNSSPMRVTIGSATLPSPVLTASGTYGYGEEYKDIADYRELGALVCKTITMNPREGNPPPRLKELPYGSLNSIGLANVGARRFTEEKLPLLMHLQCPIIVNVAGKDADEYARIIVLLEECEHGRKKSVIWGWELNLSCPNIAGGTNIGYDPALIEKTTARVKQHTRKPVLVKLPPAMDAIANLAKAAENGGADAITAINTIPGMWIDTLTRKPFFARGTAGLAGEAIFPIALAMVYTAARAVSIPVIGVGGITEPDHALQFFAAGARAVQVGSAHFKDPTLFQKCARAARKFFARDASPVYRCK